MVLAKIKPKMKIWCFLHRTLQCFEWLNLTVLQRCSPLPPSSQQYNYSVSVNVKNHLEAQVTLTLRSNNEADKTNKFTELLMQQTSHLCTLIPKEQCTKTFRLQHVIFSLHKQTPSLVKMTGRISCHYWMLILWVTRSKSSYCLCLNKECLCGKNLSPVIPLNNQSGLNVSAVEQLQQSDTSSLWQIASRHFQEQKPPD